MYILTEHIANNIMVFSFLKNSYTFVNLVNFSYGLLTCQSFSSSTPL